LASNEPRAVFFGEIARSSPYFRIGLLSLVAISSAKGQTQDNAAADLAITTAEALLQVNNLNLLTSSVDPLTTLGGESKFSRN